MKSFDIAYLMEKELEPKTKVKLAQLGIESPTYHYFKQKKLLLDNRINNKWISLSLLDCIWLKTLETLRNFGCDLRTLTKIHKELILDVTGEEILYANITDQIELLKNKKSLSKSESNKLKNLKDLENNEPLCKAISTDISIFSNMVSHAINGEKSYLILYDNIDLELIHCNNYEKLISNMQFNRPHILVEIGFLINDLLKINEFSETFDLTQLSDEEKKIIEVIRDNKVTKIEIFKSNDGGKITRVNSKRMQNKVKEKNISELIKILKEKGFSKILLHGYDGKNIQYTVDTNIKFI